MEQKEIDQIIGGLRNVSVHELKTNQYVITTRDVTVFQSYRTKICAWVGGKLYLDTNSWDYSRTTGRYRNQFLGETKKETQAKIKSGEYTLTNLN